MTAHLRRGGRALCFCLCLHSRHRTDRTVQGPARQAVCRWVYIDRAGNNSDTTMHHCSCLCTPAGACPSCRNTSLRWVPSWNRSTAFTLRTMAWTSAGPSGTARSKQCSGRSRCFCLPEAKRVQYTELHIQMPTCLLQHAPCSDPVAADDAEAFALCRWGMRGPYLHFTDVSFGDKVKHHRNRWVRPRLAKLGLG